MLAIHGLVEKEISEASMIAFDRTMRAAGKVEILTDQLGPIKVLLERENDMAKDKRLVERG